LKIGGYATTLNITTDEHDSLIADGAIFRYLYTSPPPPLPLSDAAKEAAAKEAKSPPAAE
jgi:hypothetical protein